MGQDNVYVPFSYLGRTDGEITHKLTIDEMPSHTHDIPAAWNGSGTEYIGYRQGSSGYVFTRTWGMTKTGNSQAHNNMPPYIVVKRWKRIS